MIAHEKKEARAATRPSLLAKRLLEPAHVLADEEERNIHEGSHSGRFRFHVEAKVYLHLFTSFPSITIAQWQLNNRYGSFCALAY